jgi:hypothetical protein
MKFIFYNLIILCISYALASDSTEFTVEIKKNNALCILQITKYAECIASLNKATEGKDVSELNSDTMCPVFESKKCSSFVEDTYNNIECDATFGEITKYTYTYFRLYYLAFCTKTTGGKVCPFTNLITTSSITAEQTNKSLQESCEDKNCNKAFVTMAEIIDKNITNKYLYEYLISFAMNNSYKALARSFSENKCSSIDFITSNRDLFYGVEDLYDNIINIIYQLSFGNIPNYSEILKMISKAQISIDKNIDASEKCFNQFNNYSKCFKLFQNYESSKVASSSDITNMCKKFEDDDCSNLLSDLENNNINCSGTYASDTIYRAIFISLRFTYISACTKTENNKDYCPIAKYLQTSHKVGEITKDFLQAVTDNCNDNYCSDEFYKLTDIITESNIYNAVISTEFDYKSFFNKFKKHTCNTFKIGLGIFEIIEDIFSLIHQVVASVLDLGIDIIKGLTPEYENIKDGIEKLNKNTNIFGINKECLSQVWRYSSCVKLFISNDSYKDVKNITTSDICSIFEDKNCEAFVSDLLSEENKCISSSSNHEQIYKKIHETLKLTYLSTCSKTEDSDEYCPVVDFMKDGNITSEVDIKEYKEALQNTCEDITCNKSFTEVYKIIYDTSKETLEEQSTRRRDVSVNGNVEISADIDIDLSEAINLLENNKCTSFAKLMVKEDSNSSAGELATKISLISIVVFSIFSATLLF